MIDRQDDAPAALLVFPRDCEETVRALWDYLDRTLDAPTMAAIDSHLVQCEYCREHVRFERILIDRLRSLRREHDDAVTLRGRVLTALAEAGWRRV
ncbi:MAG: zf-HC2 domain-containing protein [bacterium]